MRPDYRLPTTDYKIDSGKKAYIISLHFPFPGAKMLWNKTPEKINRKI